jgi:ferredoxin, 2Fe-2S
MSDMAAPSSETDRVKLRYGDEDLVSRRGQRLLDAILSAGIDHRHVCGGHGFCTSCRVEVVAGSEALSPVSSLERERLGLEAGCLRLACQTVIQGNASIRVPEVAAPRFSPFEDD